MRRLLVIGVLLAGSATPAHAATAPTPFCHGRPATIVGAFGEDVRGTIHGDVIVADHPNSVSSYAGDDLVCVTEDRDFDDVAIDAGPGDDVVDVSHTTGSRVDLGPGSDTFIGSPGTDRVSDGAAEDVAHHHRPGTDTIETGAGDDGVATGAVGYADTDVVQLGRGDDELALRGIPAGRFDGGAGSADVVTSSQARPRVDWRIDLAAGTWRSGSGVATIGNVEDLDLRPARWRRLEVVGSDRAETITLQHRDSDIHNGPVDLAMGGGDDVVEVDPNVVGSLDGGAGRNALSLAYGPYQGHSDASLHADLGHGFQVGHRRPVSLAGFRVLYVSDIDAVHVSGTPGPDDIETDACRADLDGGAGDDRLVAYRDCYRPPPGPAAVLHGGPGNDRMVGTDDADRLYGDAGYDSADGEGGVDRCVAEVRHDCERR